MPEGDQFFRRVDAGDCFELDFRIALANRGDVDVATGLQALCSAAKRLVYSKGRNCQNLFCGFREILPISGPNA